MRKKDAAKKRAKRIETPSNGMDQFILASRPQNSTQERKRIALQPETPKLSRNSDLDSFLF